MKQGFTLLELLVVVLIIGILTSVAVPQYRRSVRRAEMMEGLTHGKTIMDAAVRYKTVNGTVPTSFDALDIGFTGASINGNSFIDGNFNYRLLPDYVQVLSTKGNYEFQFSYPVVSNTGVTQDVFCCPINGDETGTWLCKNISNNTRAGNCYLLP